MKILHVIGTYVPAWQSGGPIKSVSALCEKLVQLSNEVTVFTTNLDGNKVLSVPTNNSISINGVEVNYFKGILPAYAFSIDLSKAIRRNIEHFDLVHIHSIFYWPITSAAFFCRKYGVPYVVSPRGMLSPPCFRKGWLKKSIYSLLIERRNLNKASIVHFTSEEERLQANHIGLTVPSITVPNGLNLEEFAGLPTQANFRKKYPETYGKRIILFLSRIVRMKGLDLLVKAFDILTRKLENIHLVIAGPDDERYGAKVKSWIRNYGIGDMVTFTGMLTGKEKLEAFVDADVFCLPSYQENFGMAVAEAMACGVPVVISDQVNIHGEVFEAKAGIITRCDAQEVAYALLRVLENRELREEAGRNGKRLVEERYSIDKVARQMMEVYESIVVGRNRG